MRTVAGLVGAARTVVDARRHAVDSLMVRERNRWASEIHDGLTQLVTTAVLELETMGKRIERDPQGAIETLAATKAAIRTSLSELRGLLFDLSREGGSGGSAGGGSLEPLEKYVNDVVERWRLPARVTVEGDLPDVPRPVLAAAYVVIRESLANAAKHASATSVSVNVRTTSDEVIVEVGDTGRGFSAIDAPSRARTRGHFGLDLVSRRVAEVGGTLDVESTPGQGTRVVARLPVRGGER
jgi:signal transduction histidine kinase